MSLSRPTSPPAPAGALSPLQAGREAPSAIAWILAGQPLTFGALAAEIHRVLGALRAHGIERGHPEPVGLVAQLDRPSLLLTYALFELGVPAVLLHPRLTAAERADQLARAGATLLLDPALAEEPTAPATPTALPPLPDDRRPLAILFTSGSSGPPKGVELARAAFLASATASAQNLGWRDDDRWLLGLPYAHVGGLSVLTRCLIARRAVVLDPQPRFDPAALRETLARHRVTLLSLVPTQLLRLLEEEGGPPPRPTPPPSLRALLLGGAAAPAALLQAARERGWPVLTTYGMTETSSQVATQRLGSAPDPGGGAPPLPGIAVRIDAEGRIAVRGDVLLERYLPAAEHPPARDADGWFRTSDLGRIDAAGNLHVLGRADEVIVTGGEKVTPGEVEAALLAHPQVAAACVFALPDPTWGQIVAAAVAPWAGHTLDEAALAAHLAGRLAPYKRPRRLVILATLPLLASGKVDRRALAARLLVP